jgi:hypothetical protein
MATTQNTFTGNGSNLGPFSFTFKWLESTDIKVSVGGVLKTAGTHYNLQSLNYNPITGKNGGEVLFTAGNAPANGASIRIYRDTDDEALSAVFSSGSAIRAKDLNDNFTQNLYVTQEVNNNALNVDGSNPMVGNLNMNGYQIDNLGEPTSDSDAATKKYIDDRYGNLSIPGFTRWSKTAVGGETTLSGVGTTGGTLGYSPNREQVYLNGAQLQRDADYTANNGTSIVLNVALIAGDVLEIICVNNLNTGTTAQAQDVYWNQSGSDAVTRTVESKLRDVVSVEDFGAVGNGFINDTAAIQAALNSGAKCVTFVGGKTYAVQTGLTAPANIVIQGNGATIAASTHFTILTVGSGASVFSLNFTGASSASYVAGSTAISCVGTNNAPAAPTYVTGPIIENCKISGFGEYAIYLAYAKSGRIAGNSITNIGYAGIGGVSCEDIVVDGNTIKTVSPGSPGGDAYGIFLDRNDGTSETAWPRSYRCIITNNTIENVTASSADNGQGIDTHAGVSFVIDSNIIKNCECGIFLTASSISGSQALGCKQCIVSNNIIEGGVNSIGYGIVVYGARNGVTVVEYAEDCIVSGNIVTGHGKQNQVSINATLFSATKNLNVTGNTFKRSVGSCVFLDFQNISFNISANTFVDPYDNTYTTPNCVHIYSIDNRGYIGGNMYRYENPGLGTYVAVQSIRIEPILTGLDLDFGRSTFQGIDATHLSVYRGTVGGVYINGLYGLSGSGTIIVSSGVADGITDVTFDKRFPYIPNVSVVLRRPFNQGGKFPVLGVDTSLAISATGFRIYALPTDGTTWSSTGTLSFDYFAT